MIDLCFQIIDIVIIVVFWGQNEKKTKPVKEQKEEEGREGDKN